MLDKVSKPLLFEPKVANLSPSTAMVRLRALLGSSYIWDMLKFGPPIAVLGDCTCSKSVMLILGTWTVGVRADMFFPLESFSADDIFSCYELM